MSASLLKKQLEIPDSALVIINHLPPWAVPCGQQPEGIPCNGQWQYANILAKSHFRPTWKRKLGNRLTESLLPSSSCGGRTRTCDLQVMSLASYQLLHSAMLIICAFLDCVCKGMKFSGNCKTFQRKSLVFGVILTCINEIMRICWFESVFGTFWCVRWRDCRNMIAFPFRMFGTNVMDAEERLRRNGLYGSVIYGHLGLADCCL